LIDARIQIDTIVYSEVLAQNPAVQKHVRLCRRTGVPVARVTPDQVPERKAFFERMRSLVRFRREAWPYEYQHWKSQGWSGMTTSP
jgi:hypothetical protein